VSRIFGSNKEKMTVGWRRLRNFNSSCTLSTMLRLNQRILIEFCNRLAIVNALVLPKWLRPQPPAIPLQVPQPRTNKCTSEEIIDASNQCVTKNRRRHLYRPLGRG
jgi:hypothetical protein